MGSDDSLHVQGQIMALSIAIKRLLDAVSPTKGDRLALLEKIKDEATDPSRVPGAIRDSEGFQNMLDLLGMKELDT